ncbi:MULTISPECIES: ribosomal protein L7/L12 [unclassified Pedobacter]|uniref:ribosomal protein L7/L12 n=1 Tax=unclassified Pedobacter TaxID=2628915 RepID=UPI001423A5EC|nr:MULTISPECIES: ribosomal protein L7/L12 [unclassified Pedobacter]NII81832.1 ribosomal protein L7/L12 [Pedobacter sp. SG908]NMN35835.1 ribosomal protein L7/L12 [Pedobacter sp. SG918]
MINVSPEAKQKALLFLSRNQKVAAVKVVKDHSGCGLKEAKDYVDALEEGVNQPVTNLADLDAELLVILSQGNKLNAIKHYKDVTGLGLAESKDYIEKLMQFKVSGNMMQQSRDTDVKNIVSANVTNNQNPPKNFLIKLLIIILIAAALAYFMFKI